ncbi:hypothetical protein [Natronoglycomyces albus]|uniref:Uncharacterized protein n=1 Tax=Natronoglycomyces albus TaxID=2811108 RepID=A0A895XUR9_9ACTN|nr:hypothetical protein [Natronoglycomyces albus]QSB05970.1 hypothetical protein JQS30_03320 [Natronoglycomyces albus]
MSAPTGFSYSTRRNGSVVIFFANKVATTLKGQRAAKFLADIDAGDEQLVMAKWTGNFKRGNERSLKKSNGLRTRR